MRTAEELLFDWGIWCRHGNGMPCYTSPALALVRDNIGASVRSAIISDDEAAKQIAELEKLQPTTYESEEVINVESHIGELIDIVALGAMKHSDIKILSDRFSGGSIKRVLADKKLVAIGVIIDMPVEKPVGVFQAIPVSEKNESREDGHKAE